MSRSRVLAVSLAMVGALASCGSNGDVGGVGEAGVCALEAELDGRTYVANGGFHQIPDRGERLGLATVPSCGTEPPWDLEAYAIVGVDPAIAFIAPNYEDSVFPAAGEDHPAELLALRAEPECAGREPVELDGQWLGILGRDGDTERDLLPPYDISMRVDDASSDAYEDAFITVLVELEAGTPITRHDVRTSLWEGGTIHIVATCRDGAFEANEISTSPPA